jgi:phosphoglycerate kinase
MVAVAKLLPSFAGFRLEKEIKMLGGVFADSRKPFVAVLGGAKISTKLPLIRRFLDEADSLLVGGAIASTIFYLFGYEVGKSIIDKDAGRIVKAALFKNKKLHLPVDVVVAKSLSRESRHKVKKPEEAKKNDFIVDIGPESAKLFASFARSAKTIVWNGPLGYTPYFPRGTISFARALGKMKAFKVVGGGDTIAALRKRGLLKGFSHVSTGGGAMLEFLAGKKLPGIEALREK